MNCRERERGRDEWILAGQLAQAGGLEPLAGARVSISLCRMDERENFQPLLLRSTLLKSFRSCEEPVG